MPWVGITPANADRIEGLIEVPALAESLTLNKGDFLRTGARGALFLAYRKAIQEAVAAQLETCGSAPAERTARRRTRPIERDLRRVLGELAESYPILATLAERRAGGQRRLPLGEPAADSRENAALWSGSSPLAVEPSGPGPDADTMESAAGGSEAPDDAEESGASRPPETTERTEPPETATHPREAATARDGIIGVRLPGRARRKRPATLSLEIRFESLPGDPSLGRLVESTVWVNEAHPAWRRASASRSESYHIALSVAMALAPFTVEAEDVQLFINRFLSRWGEAALGHPGRH